MNPTNPMPWFNAARTYQQLGMKVAAMMHMDKATELDPLPAMAHVDRAYCNADWKCE
jgi:hypothetical protein